MFDIRCMPNSVIKYKYKEVMVGFRRDTSQNKLNKKWQVTYIAPLNHLPLLPSGSGGVQQELVV